MWYLSHLVDYYRYLDYDRAETSTVDVLTHYDILFLHRRIGSGHVVAVQNSLAEPVMKITHAMFAEGAICLDNICVERNSPLSYWRFDEFPSECM